MRGTPERRGGREGIEGTSAIIREEIRKCQPIHPIPSPPLPRRARVARTELEESADKGHGVGGNAGGSDLEERIAVVDLGPRVSLRSLGEAACRVPGDKSTAGTNGQSVRLHIWFSDHYSVCARIVLSEPSNRLGRKEGGRTMGDEMRAIHSG